MLLDVSVLSPKEVIYEGKAKSVTLPGEAGIFEVLVFHRPILSRLISGMLFIDEQGLLIQRGIAKVSQNKVMVIVETA